MIEVDVFARQSAVVAHIRVTDVGDECRGLEGSAAGEGSMFL